MPDSFLQMFLKSCHWWTWNARKVFNWDFHA